jgi:hypothetical protein
MHGLFFNLRRKQAMNKKLFFVLLLALLLLTGCATGKFYSYDSGLDKDDQPNITNNNKFTIAVTPFTLSDKIPENHQDIAQFEKHFWANNIVQLLKKSPYVKNAYYSPTITPCPDYYINGIILLSDGENTEAEISVFVSDGTILYKDTYGYANNKNDFNDSEYLYKPWYKFINKINKTLRETNYNKDLLFQKKVNGYAGTVVAPKKVNDKLEKMVDEASMYERDKLLSFSTHIVEETCDELKQQYIKWQKDSTLSAEQVRVKKNTSLAMSFVAAAAGAAVQSAGADSSTLQQQSDQLMQTALSKDEDTFVDANIAYDEEKMTDDNRGIEQVMLKLHQVVKELVIGEQNTQEQTLESMLVKLHTVMPKHPAVAEVVKDEAINVNSALDALIGKEPVEDKSNDSGSNQNKPGDKVSDEAVSKTPERTPQTAAEGQENKSENKIVVSNENIAPMQLSDNADNIVGSTWYGTGADTDYIEYTFEKDGTLLWKNLDKDTLLEKKMIGEITGRATWEQAGDRVYMQMNNKGYIEYEGIINGNQMEGTLWTIKGTKKNWSAYKRSNTATPEHPAVAEVATAETMNVNNALDVHIGKIPVEGMSNDSGSAVNTGDNKVSDEAESKTAERIETPPSQTAAEEQPVQENKFGNETGVSTENIAPAQLAVNGDNVVGSTLRETNQTIVPDGSPQIKTEKDIYNIGEKIRINFFNAPGKQTDWICIAKAGSPDSEVQDYQYLPEGLTQGVLTFDTFMPGKYEARAFYNYRHHKYVVTARYSFSVKHSAVTGDEKPLIIKGLYLGMDVNDARNILSQLLPKRWRISNAGDYGLWDAVFLGFMLERAEEREYALMYYNHRNEEEMIQWRQEMDRMAVDNAELRAKLDVMDQHVANLQGTPVDPAYVPEGAQDIALSPDVIDKLTQAPPTAGQP